MKVTGKQKTKTKTKKNKEIGLELLATYTFFHKMPSKVNRTYKRQRAIKP